MRITLETGGPAELVRVDGATTGLVLIPDIGGLRPLFDEHVARLSSELGFTVCAPEPFPGRESMQMNERMEAMKALRDDDMLACFEAAADATGCARTCVLGFCMGGMYSLKAAGTRRFDRAVSFYGMIRVPDAWRGPGQADPLEAIRQAGVAESVLAVIGGKDVWTPPQDVEDLKAAGVRVEFYPDGEHGFAHDPARPAHRPDDARDAWTKAKAWLV